MVGLPIGWSGSAGIPPLYTLGTERGNAHGGAVAAFIARTATSPTRTPSRVGTMAAAESSFAVLSQSFRADEYRGRRVRWSGWLRSTMTTGEGAALWMRIDGPGVMLGFDNMAPRMVTATSGWEQFSVVLDVPDRAIGIALGLYMVGVGDVVADDFALEVVGDSVAVTDLTSGPEPMGTDSVTVAGWYANARGAPRNLRFEGLGEETASAASWLSSVAVPLATAQPGADVTDLAPLRAMIGPARLVGMGEGTHGTREFFQLKHRVLQYLVSEMGFTHFAIEATWPEANDVNTYVLTGQGDPARLLSRLGFWTWNTQEVLDLILWIRQWNATAPSSRRVQFMGFDIQYPGAAMDTVASFVGRVDSAKATFVSSRYACLVPYRNIGTRFSQPSTAYAALPAGDRAACHAALQEVFTLLRDDSAAYSGASSAAVYANALHSARAVQQFEEFAAASASSSASNLVRDRHMAENVQWLLQQAGPSARMMLWAHNGHVANVAGWMGGALRSAYGDDYVNLGFLFGTGSFNSVGTGSGSGLRAWPATVVPEGSLESIFIATGRPLLLFDTRRVATGGSAAALLAGPLPMRSIGAVFNPAYETQYFAYQVFPADYQLLMFVRSSTPSTLLPFVSASAPWRGP